jgi:hypothetical protein
MKVFSRALVFPIAISLCACALYAAADTNIWPQPFDFQPGSRGAEIDPNTFMIKTNSESKVIGAAIERLQKDLFPFGTPKTLRGSSRGDTYIYNFIILVVDDDDRGTCYSLATN